jgi:hypothetical protein
MQRRTLLAALILALTGAASGEAFNSTFTEWHAFPASQGFTTACAALPSNQVAVYDGYSLWLQDGAGQDAFSKAATGYEGDPADIAISPDGRRALLLAGGNDFGDTSDDYLYLVNLRNPQNYAPGDELTVIPFNYSAVWLDDRHILVENNPTGGSFGTDTELGIIDLQAGGPDYGYRTVVDKGGYSAGMAADRHALLVYALKTDFVNPDEVRCFQRSDLLQAYEDGVTLTWESGALIGDPETTDYNSGGVMAVSSLGSLILGGMPPVQFVDADTGAIVGTADPEGSGFAWYSGGTYLRNGKVVLTEGTTGFVSDETWEPMPVWGWGAVVACAGLLGLAARRRLA